MKLQYRVWAPLPEKVELAIGGRRRPMDRAPDGWWTATEVEYVPGTDYGFVLDGEGPFPDPRSPWQPSGVHGLSRALDLKSFIGSDTGWQPPEWGSALVYELHVGTFTSEGTFAAAIERLSDLAALGVTHVELMPVAEFPGRRGWGYDGVALYAPHQAYGGPEGLRQFVSACHRLGLAAILDVVYNHLGPSGNYLGRFAPYFTDRYNTPWGEALNFDGADSDEVRRFFVDNALMWLGDYHFDGLRLDAVHAIRDCSAVTFLEQLNREVRALASQRGRPLLLIPESDLNDPRLLWSIDRGGYGLDAQWSDDFHHALHAVLTRERSGYYADFGSLADLAEALRHAYVYAERYSPHRRRRHGRSAGDLNGRRFLAYLQNHDQIGNRAQGERSGMLLSPGRLKIGAALVFTSPYVPMLFQGEEWGASTPFQYFTDHQEPELGRAVSEGRRREFAAFGWKPEKVPDPQDPATFERSRLCWEEREQSAHAAILDWHRQLIQLRRAEPTLTNGERDQVLVRFDEDAAWLIMERSGFTVAVNLGETGQAIEIKEGEHQLLLGSEPGIECGRKRISLPPESVAILKSVGV